MFLKNVYVALAGVAHLVGVSFCTLKGYRINLWSEHMPGLWVRALVTACTRGNPSMFFSLSLLCPKPMKKCPWVRILKKQCLCH